MTSNCIIFFDTESVLEGPWREAFDFKQGIGTIRALLSSHKVAAVFNVCGKLLQSHPDLFRALEEEGHEIALHGWLHENVRFLNDEELYTSLRRSHDAYGDVLGHPPAGFRAPWLDYDGRLIAWLSDHAYLWTSHRHLMLRERFLTPALRPELKVTRLPGAAWSALREHCHALAPARIGPSLWDIPLTSSMDGELLGLVSPLQASPVAVTEYCLSAWMAQAGRHRDCFTLNLHDWLMGTANRPALLEAAITGLLQRGFTITTATRLLQETDADAG